MRLLRVTGFVAVCAVLLMMIRPGLAAAECGTQGAFALAVAQLLGYEVTDHDAAMATLTNVGVEPKGGWDPQACMTEEVAGEIDKDLKNAVSLGIFNPQDVAGVVILALESIGAGDVVQAMNRMPNPYLGGGSRVGGPPLEGSSRIPESPAPPPPPTTTTSSRPPASPFIP